MKGKLSSKTYFHRSSVGKKHLMYVHGLSIHFCCVLSPEKNSFFNINAFSASDFMLGCLYIKGSFSAQENLLRADATRFTRHFPAENFELNRNNFTFSRQSERWRHPCSQNGGDWCRSHSARMA